MQQPRAPRFRTLTAWLTAGAVLLVLGGCIPKAPPPRWSPSYLRYYVVKVLDVEEPTPAWYRERARLEVMGPELDRVLILVVEEGRENDHVRANAVALLAERDAFGAEPLLRRLLASSGTDLVRAAAATGLKRYAAESPEARNALRAALGDPSRTVRLNALQALDVEDAPLLRALLERDDDVQIRTIGRQLLSLFEARGAPLARDARGQLRTAGADSVPHVVFQPAARDSLAGAEVGALWVQMPGGAALLPLAQVVEVAGGVVPAFFNQARTAVVYEAEREIRVRDLATGGTRDLGAGIAPRVVPFTDRFVFLREVPGTRREEAGGVAFEYAVLRSSFAGGEPEDIGRLRAVLRGGGFGGLSPARTMVVSEQGQRFVLRGEGVTPFPLP